MDSNLSVNIAENQPLNDLDKLIIQENPFKQANLILTDLSSSINVEDKMIQNQVEEMESKLDKGEKAKPNLIGQCSLNVDFNQTFNTLNELSGIKKLKPAQSEINLVLQQDTVLQLHEIVNDENLSDLKLEQKNLIETKASSGLVFTMRSATCTQTTTQEKEDLLIKDQKPDLKNANQDLITQESINIQQNLSLMKSEDLELKKLEASKIATQNLEAGYKSLSIDEKLTQEKEGTFLKEKINEFKGGLSLKSEEAICVQTTTLHDKENELKQFEKELNKATAELITSKTMNMSEISILEKEEKYLQLKPELSSATKSLDNLNALTIEQINQQFSAGKLKIKKEKPSKATINTAKKKIATKEDNLKLETEQQFETELRKEQNCDVTQIGQNTVCSSENQILENEKVCEIEKPKKLKAKRDLSENRQQSIQMNEIHEFDSAQNLDTKLMNIKNANVNVDQQNTLLQINQKTPLELAKQFKEDKKETQIATDSKLINLQIGLQVNEIQLIDHLNKVDLDIKKDAKADVSLINQQALSGKDVLTLDSSKEFIEKIDTGKIKQNFIDKHSLQITESKSNEKESILDTKQPKKEKLKSIQSVEQINLVEITSMITELSSVQEKGK